jgi:hypothetical protein
MGPIERMKRDLAEATSRPAMNPEIRSQTLALLCVAEWLDQFEHRFQAIERALGKR